MGRLKLPLLIAIPLGALAWYLFDRWRPRRDWPGQPHPYTRGRWES